MPTCPVCQSPHAATDILCPACGTLTDPTGRNAFDLLGLTPTFALDMAALEAAYLARQQQAHPDRFTTATAEEQARAAAFGAALNEAFSILKNDINRALQLFEIKNFENPLSSAAQLPPELLARQFELRERLADGEDPAALAKDIAADLATTRTTLAQAFESKDMAAAAEQLVALSYLQKFAKELKNPHN